MNDTKPVRVLLVTGSHPFDPRLYGLFDGHPDIEWDKKSHGSAPCRVFAAGFADDYDVVVLHDFEFAISEDQKAAFLAAFGDGRGLVVWHHALCSHPEWPAYRELAGGQFFFEPRDGHPASEYFPDVLTRYETAGLAHPASQGVGPFEAVEEPYRKVWMAEGAEPMLLSSTPESDRVVAWSTRHGASRIAAVVPGHGWTIFEDPGFRRFMAQTLRWAAGRENMAGPA